MRLVCLCEMWPVSQSLFVALTATLVLSVCLSVCSSDKRWWDLHSQLYTDHHQWFNERCRLRHDMTYSVLTLERSLKSLLIAEPPSPAPLHLYTSRSQVLQCAVSAGDIMQCVCVGGGRPVCWSCWRLSLCL